MLSSRAIVVIAMSLAIGSVLMALDRMLDASADVASASVETPTRPALSKADQSQSPPIGPHTQTLAIDTVKPSTGSAGSAWALTRPNDNATSPPPLVRLKNGKLSIQARQVPLDDLLTKISDKSAITIHRGKASEALISIAFKGVALDEGLRRIIKDQDIFIFYGAGASQPTTVWVYPRGQGRELVPSPQGWAASAHFEQDLSSANWGVRVRAIETIVARQGKQSVDDVLYALNDTNPNVRYSALSSALTISVPLPAGTLENLAQYDRSHFVRALALKAIGEAPKADKLQATSMAQAALDDPHQHVQAQARDVLATLKAGSRP
jgi:hypothetical protein